MSESNTVNLNSPTANMYGCEPCPKCGSKFRFQLAQKPNEIQCDDCGSSEKRSEYSAHERKLGAMSEVKQQAARDLATRIHLKLTASSTSKHFEWLVQELLAFAPLPSQREALPAEVFEKLEADITALDEWHSPTLGNKIAIGAVPLRPTLDAVRAALARAGKGMQT